MQKQTEDNFSSWPENTIYFLTDSTFLHYPYFKSDEQKQIVLDQIIKISKELNIPISDYSISINHYHLKFYIRHSYEMEKIKQFLRGGISYYYRKKYPVIYREMWQSRKILRVTSEKMNWKISGYIIGNLLKHKEVSTFDELKNNKFSSYYYLSQKYGEEEMKFLVYSVIDIDESSEGVVDMEKINELLN